MALSIPTNLPAAGSIETRKKGRSARELVEADENRNAHKLSSDQFEHLLVLIADGVRATDALEVCNATRYGLDNVLRNNEAARAKYEEAKILALWRRIDLDTMEEILAEIAAGSYAKDACQDRLIPPADFYRLVLKDPLVKELYEDARRIQMESMADDIVEISDNEGRDVIMDADGGERSNSAAVQRDRIRADNRKWLMGRLHHERFGDRQKVDLEANVTIDYANRLESARRRKTSAKLEE